MRIVTGYRHYKWCNSLGQMIQVSGTVGNNDRSNACHGRSCSRSSLTIRSRNKHIDRLADC